MAYRVNASVYHMTVALSDAAVDYEVKSGPFTEQTNIFPDWAPSYGGEGDCRIYETDYV